MEWNKENAFYLAELIGKAIRGRRIQKEMSQEELSRTSGVSSASIARFETGKGNISLHNLLLILKALEMADELKLIFKGPELSPSMLAKATTQKTRSRVRKSHATSKITKKEWKWGEDEK